MTPVEALSKKQDIKTVRSALKKVLTTGANKEDKAAVQFIETE
jgi:hypothetical protein